MLNLNRTNMSNAIEKAKTIRPHVRQIADRTYSVTGSKAGTTYTVRFLVRDGVKLGSCNCKAGEAGTMCYHQAAAAAVNIAIQSMRRRAIPAVA